MCYACHRWYSYKYIHRHEHTHKHIQNVYILTQTDEDYF
jgi:hypothetical protein